MAKPVTVGPHARSLGLLDLSNALFACLTAVWIVKAGSALELGVCVTSGVKANRGLTSRQRIGTRPFSQQRGLHELALYNERPQKV
jgi:hypothetical protein